MLNLGRVWILLVVSLEILWAGGVTATVNSPEVVKGNFVQLRIKAVGGRAAFPSLSKIGGYSTSQRGESSQYSMSIVNGSYKNERSTTLSVIFFPQKDMVIPSYNIKIGQDSYTTKPINITVVPAGKTVSKQNSIFKIDMVSSKKSMIVGESALITLHFRLKHGVRLSQEIEFTPPHFKDFIVKKTDDKKAYNKNGYQVQEIEYLITAQKEGNSSISPALVKLGLPDRSRRDVFGLSYGTKWVQGASNGLELKVLPKSQESDLVGDFYISTTISKNEAKVNEPINITIKIEGEGNLVDFEFPKYDIDGVMVYSDEAKVESKVVDGKLFSSYTKSFALIGDRNFTVPSKNFTALITDTNKLKELTSKSFQVKILSRPALANTNKNGTIYASKVNKIKTDDAKVEKVIIEKNKIVWWMLVLAFLLGALFASMFSKIVSLVKSKKENPYKNNEALKVLYPHISCSKKIEEMVRKLYAKREGDKTVTIDKKELRAMIDRLISKKYR